MNRSSGLMRSMKYKEQKEEKKSGKKKKNNKLDEQNEGILLYLMILFRFLGIDLTILRASL